MCSLHRLSREKRKVFSPATEPRTQIQRQTSENETERSDSRKSPVDTSSTVSASLCPISFTFSDDFSSLSVWSVHVWCRFEIIENIFPFFHILFFRFVARTFGIRACRNSIDSKIKRKNSRTFSALKLFRASEVTRRGGANRRECEPKKSINKCFNRKKIQTKCLFISECKHSTCSQITISSSVRRNWQSIRFS